MNPAHAHLLLNHFPIIGTLIGSSVLLFGLYSKILQIKLTGLFLVSIMAIIAIPVFLTGEPAEEVVEDLAGISKSAIESHEEAAELAFWLMEVTGLLCFVSLAFHFLKSEYLKRSVLVSLLFSFITFGAMARAGYLGGQIRHSELTKNSTSAKNFQTESGEEDDDD